MLKKILISAIFILAYNFMFSSEVPNNYTSDNINKISINLFTFQLGTDKNLPYNHLPLSNQSDYSKNDEDGSFVVGFGVIAFFSSCVLCLLGVFSMLISIPFLSCGIYGYSQYKNDTDKNYIIAGGVLLGAGFVCCLPMIIIGILFAAETLSVKINHLKNEKLNFPILPNNPIPTTGKVL